MQSSGPPPRLSIRSFPAQLVLLGMWALLLGLSFPSPNWWVLAHFALVPLAILALRGSPLRRVAALTWAVAFIWWAVMLRWMVPVTTGGVFGLSAYMALYPLAFVLVLRFIDRRASVPLTFAVPMVWVALEYLRGLLLTGFPWFQLGHSQPTVMIQIADTVGAYGVSFVVAMTSGLIADLLTRPLVRRGGRWGTPVRNPLVAWAAVFAITLGYGIFRLAQHDSAQVGEPLTVALVQTNVPQSNKTQPSEEQDRQNFSRMVALTELAAEELAPHVIVWPETMVPRAINDESLGIYRQLAEPARAYTDYREVLESVAREHGVSLIVGAHAMTQWELRSRDDGMPYYMYGRRYNAAYHLDAAGSLAGRYDKVHRVPFGEYIPWVERWDTLRELMVRYLTPYDEDYSLSPGAAFDLLRVDGPGEEPWRVAAPICFEDVVSRVPRRMVYDGGRKRAHLLVNLSNDGWFAGTSQGPQHEQIARFRCVENRVPMARSVNTGISSFIDASGRVIERVRTDGRTQEVWGVGGAELTRDRRSTVFGRIGDAFALLCLLATGGLVVLGGMVRTQGRPS